MNNNFGGYPMSYQQNLMNLRNDIDNRLNQMYSQNQQPAPITQNFQIAPSTNNNGIQFVENDEQVKKALVFNDSLFVNKNFNTLWFKNVSGSVKKYELKEIVELDEKDVMIAELMAKIKKLESGEINESNVENDVTTIATKKSSNVRTSKSNDE